ncbi:MAG: histidinol-phosphate transaminase [Clostridia bacterium]|nr:histidinol-phosphate transaminase [Clostridia bacterium]
MSRFLTEKFALLTPYTPGEQPKDMKYIKLNTNESPFPPSDKAIAAAAEAAKTLELYSDPECRDLVSKAVEVFGVERDEILFTNGSDEILNFAFMAFCDATHPALFPDITYGFYPVFAELGGIPYKTARLRDDFTIDPNDYKGHKGAIFIANPNAPTGIALSLAEIEQIILANPESVVIIDEAYVDFGAESALSLIHKYDNLLVTQTFSKSRSMAGARLGFGAGCKELIRDLNTIKYSTNPYNVNRMTMAAGIGVLCDEDYTKQNCQKIIENREYTKAKLKELGFTLTDSVSNFIFAKSDKISGEQLYLTLKERGILIRHFSSARLCEYNRITVGNREQMDALLDEIKRILEETV